MDATRVLYSGSTLNYEAPRRSQSMESSKGHIGSRDELWPPLTKEELRKNDMSAWEAVPSLPCGDIQQTALGLTKMVTEVCCVGTRLATQCIMLIIFFVLVYAGYRAPSEHIP